MSYKATFSLSKRLPLNTGLTVSGQIDKTTPSPHPRVGHNIAEKK